MISLGAKLSLALALLLGGLYALPAEDIAAQSEATLGVDTMIEGNGPSLVDEVDRCRSVETGEVFEVDLYITDAEELTAFEVYFAFDPAILEVLNHDLQMFLFSTPNVGSLLSASDPLPDSSGRHFLAATELPSSPDSGSGVLARLLLRAKTAGRSPAVYAAIDINGDGSIDLGPRLTSATSQAYGDNNGDSFFDGTVSQGEIAVGEPCLTSPPTSTPEPNDTPSPSPTPQGSPSSQQEVPPSLQIPAPLVALSDSALAATGSSRGPSDGTQAEAGTGDSPPDAGPEPAAEDDEAASAEAEPQSDGSGPPINQGGGDGDNRLLWLLGGLAVLLLAGGGTTMALRLRRER